MKKILFILFGITLIACKKESKGDIVKKPATETFTSGETYMFVDESVYPISQALVEVFESYYSNAKINSIQKNETAIMNQLFQDSVRLAIVPRDLTQKELDFLSTRVSPITTPIAREAVVFIQNAKNQDTILKLDRIREIIKDENSKTKLIFDDINSSVVRLINDSIKIDAETPNSYFMPDTKKVMEYISKNKNAIGIISSAWLAEPDEEVKKMSENIRSMYLFNPETEEYVRPSQSTVADKSYPLIRTINIIDIKGNAGLGKGFSAFAASDKGQRIILKSGLVPIKFPTREIMIKEN